MNIRVFLPAFLQERREVWKAKGASCSPNRGDHSPTRGSREFTAVNVEGTKTVITEAGKAGVRRAVVMSSNSPIGVSRNPFEVFDEESPYNPYVGYGRSKQAIEPYVSRGGWDSACGGYRRNGFAPQD